MAEVKIQPLQPIEAAIFDSTIAEPSGLTFCYNKLFAICDKSKCHYIYQVDSHGNVVSI